MPAREPQRVRRQRCLGQLYLRAIVVLVFRDEQMGRARRARRLLRRRAVRRARCRGSGSHASWPAQGGSPPLGVPSGGRNPGKVAFLRARPAGRIRSGIGLASVTASVPEEVRSMPPRASGQGAGERARENAAGAAAAAGATAAGRPRRERRGGNSAKRERGVEVSGQSSSRALGGKGRRRAPR